MNRKRFYQLRHHYRILAEEDEYGPHPAVGAPCFIGFEKYEPPQIWRNYQIYGRNLVEVWKQAKRMQDRYRDFDPRSFLKREMRSQYSYH